MGLGSFAALADSWHKADWSSADWGAWNKAWEACTNAYKAAGGNSHGESAPEPADVPFTKMWMPLALADLAQEEAAQRAAQDAAPGAAESSGQQGRAAAANPATRADANTRAAGTTDGAASSDSEISDNPWSDLPPVWSELPPRQAAYGARPSVAATQASVPQGEFGARMARELNESVRRKDEADDKAEIARFNNQRQAAAAPATPTMRTDANSDSDEENPWEQDAGVSRALLPLVDGNGWTWLNWFAERR